jgi:para-aminobenzoate synthetase component II
MILMIDNFDSFTFNLVQGFESMGEEVAVFRNDAIDIDSIKRMSPSGIIISPGPGSPRSAGISIEVIRHFYPEVPIFGVCLGHQCIAEAFGGNVVHADRVMHGKFSSISHDGRDLFTGLPQDFRAVRYHSLAVDKKTLPGEILVCASSDDGEIMGIRHEHYPLYGVQFHPESIATEYGYEIMSNFMAKTKEVA